MADSKKQYVVTAPYVTLHCVDANGAPVIVGFYKDALVPAGVTAESLKHHLDGGMVAEVGEAAAEAKAEAKVDAKTAADEAKATEAAAKAQADEDATAKTAAKPTKATS